jgi:hypothetical protein
MTSPGPLRRLDAWLDTEVGWGVTRRHIIWGGGGGLLAAIFVLLIIVM